MPKALDTQVLNSVIQAAVESVFGRMLHVKPAAATLIEEKDIIEFESRMRLFPMEKFNGPCFIASINCFLSPKDVETGHVVGTFVLFVKEEVAEKFLRAFDRSIKEAENESNLLDVVGQMAGIVAAEIKAGLTAQGVAELVLSNAVTFKNHIPEGVPFDYNLYQKQELSFSFWGQKSIVVEACLGQVPQKG